MRRPFVPLLLALSVGGSACRRDLNLPAPAAEKPPPAALGRECSADDGCLSSHCQDGVCCERACDTFEHCNKPGKAGRCDPSVPGDSCVKNEECPPDAPCWLYGRAPNIAGVCCAQRAAGDVCGGLCDSCVNPGHLGTCQVADDDTDPRAQCGTCGACFAGRCDAANVGTDPAGACGAGKTCNPYRQCAGTPGATCAGDADCAAGQCVDGLCLSRDVELVFAYPMASSATYREISQVEESPDGTSSVLFTEYSAYTDSGGALVISENALFLALRTPGGKWQATQLVDDGGWGFPGYVPGAMLGQGRGAYVATLSRADVAKGTCGKPGAPPCGLFGASFVDGVLGVPEVIDPAMKELTAVSLARLDDGTVVVSYADRNELYLRRHPVGGAWSAADHVASIFAYTASGNPFVQPRVIAAAGKLTSFYFDKTSTLLTVKVDGGPPELVPTPTPAGDTAPCDANSTFVPQLLPANGGRPEGVSAAFVCDGQSAHYWVLLHFFPSLSGAARWETTLLSFPAGLPGWLEPLPPVGNAALYAELQNARGEVELTWPDGAGAWQSRTAFQMTGNAEIFAVSSGRTAAGDPLLGVGLRSLPDAPAISPDLYLVRYHR